MGSKDVFEMDSGANLRKSHAEWIRAALGGAEMGTGRDWDKKYGWGK